MELKFNRGSDGCNLTRMCEGSDGSSSPSSSSFIRSISLLMANLLEEIVYPLDRVHLIYKRMCE